MEPNVRDAFQGDVNEDAKTTASNKADAVKDGEDLGEAGEEGAEGLGESALGDAGACEVGKGINLSSSI